MSPCIGNQPFYTFRNIGYDVLVYILPCVHILFLLLIHAKITIIVQITGGCISILSMTHLNNLLKKMITFVHKLLVRYDEQNIQMVLLEIIPPGIERYQ